MTTKIELLNKCRDIIGSDRPGLYGDALINFKAIGRLVEDYDMFSNNRHQYGAQHYSAAHEHAIHMALTKIGRIATGQPGVEDSYLDAIGYLALAWEIVQNDMRGPDAK